MTLVTFEIEVRPGGTQLHHGIRFREDSARPACRGVHRQRWRLERAGEAHRNLSFQTVSGNRRLAEVRNYLDQISEQWDGALARLRVFVEDSLISCKLARG
jgi:hypothetical protein